MPVTKEQAGTYRQIADILRWRRADGERVRSIRPGRTEKEPEYTDSHEKPTIVEFKEGDAVDVEMLLKGRAVARYEKTQRIQVRENPPAAGGSTVAHEETIKREGG